MRKPLTFLRKKLYQFKIVLFMMLFAELSGCREAYDPSLETPAVNFMVVEGFINTKGVTIIKLTRTQKLVESSVIKNELKATVQIEDDNNIVAVLNETDPGVYRTAVLNLPDHRKYRLRIKTTGRKEYLSEYSAVKTSPKVQLTWKRSADGVRIYASTTDPANQTLYYKYDYEDTWSQRSLELSENRAVQLPNGNMAIVIRPDQDQIDALICWTSGISNKVMTTTTAHLSKDAVDKFMVQFIPNGDERLAVRYSVLVKQYGLSPEAFGFFEQMKKNTELLGSVFDPLPSTMRGNIQSINDPSEPVIGYIVAASTAEQRLFIEKEEVPNWRFELPCRQELVFHNQSNLNLYLRNDRFLFHSYQPDNRFSVVEPACLDCRKRNGHNLKPSFW